MEGIDTEESLARNSQDQQTALMSHLDPVSLMPVINAFRAQYLSYRIDFSRTLLMAARVPMTPSRHTAAIELSTRDAEGTQI